MGVRLFLGDPDDDARTLITEVEIVATGLDSCSEAIRGEVEIAMGEEGLDLGGDGRDEIEC